MLRRLLAVDGSIWISVDDNEAHYLKVLCDEISGARTSLRNVIWQKIFAPKSSARDIYSASHDHILIFARVDRTLLKGARLIRVGL
jgi:adenine-specific DNA-methyltransferase